MTMHGTVLGLAAVYLITGGLAASLTSSAVAIYPFCDPFDNEQQLLQFGATSIARSLLGYAVHRWPVALLQALLLLRVLGSRPGRRWAVALGLAIPIAYELLLPHSDDGSLLELFLGNLLVGCHNSATLGAAADIVAHAAPAIVAASATLTLACGRRSKP